MDAAPAGGDFLVTIRLIRSFEHRNIRHLVVRVRDPRGTTVDRWMEDVRTQASQAGSGLPPPFRNYSYDTMKIEHQAHGAKTSDPVINCEDDDLLILKANSDLLSSGVKNETVVSFFKMDDYRAYKKEPSLVW